MGLSLFGSNGVEVWEAAWTVNISGYNRYSYFKFNEVFKILYLIDWVDLFKLVI
jgi:hypothetical protein